MSALRKSAIIVALMAASLSSATAQEITAPDFAYPKEAARTAEKDLQIALRDGNGPATVREIINLGLSLSAIAADNLPDVVSRISEVAANEAQPDTKALLHTLEAEIYLAIYQDEKLTYDRRSLPLTPLPADYHQWSGDHFRYKISQLCDSALMDQQPLKATPITAYKGAITLGELTATYYPTLFDFVAYRTIGIRQQLSPISNCLPWIYFCDRGTYIAFRRFHTDSQQAAKILDTYAQLLRFHAPDSAPAIWADINRISFVADGAYRTKSYAQINAECYRLLKQLYTDNSHLPWSSDVLLTLKDYIQLSLADDSNAKWLVAKARENLQRFPSSPRNGCLENIIANFTSGSVTVRHPSTAYPGRAIELEVTATNLNEVKINVYYILEKGISVNEEYLSALTPIDQINVKIPGTAPFMTEAKVNYTLSQPGYYVFTIDRSTSGKGYYRYYDPVRCTGLTLEAITYNGAATALVVDPLTGAPIADASILASKNSNDSKRKIGLTDANGLLEIDSNLSGQSLKATKGTDTYAEPQYIYFNQYPLSDNLLATTVTDLPIYKPGETVNFCATIYRTTSDRRRELCPHKKISAILMDVSDTELDTITATTDDFGRLTGSFTLPTDRLIGIYSIRFTDQKRFIGSHSLMVSDYKAPTFKIDILRVEKSTPEKGDVTIVGNVKSYSGMPLADTQVNMTLSAEYGHFRFASNPIKFYSDSVATNSSGEFSFVVKNSDFVTSPAPDGIFNAVIAATSISGETQQAETAFTLAGKSITLSAEPIGEINITRPVNFAVTATNQQGDIVKTPINYILEADGKTIKKGLLAKALDWKAVEPGTYTLHFTAADADTLTVNGVIVYSPTGKKSPSTKPVWVPRSSKSIYLTEQGVDIIYGVPANDSWVLAMLCDDNKVVSKQWLRASAGMHAHHLSLPSDFRQGYILLIANRDLESVSEMIRLEQRPESLNIEIESLRDNITPGATTRWTIRTTNAKAQGVESAIIAGMYNRALSALLDRPWNFSLRNINLPNPQTRLFENRYLFVSASLATSETKPCVDIVSPIFNTWNRQWISTRHVVYYSMSRAPMNKSTNYSAIEATEETAANMDGADLHEEAKTSGLESLDAKTNFEYRDGFQPLAFFKPSLQTDADGSLNFSFEAPSQNTTWLLQMVALDRNSNFATRTAEIIANKPVMVSANLPRFLRQGDRATVGNLIANNSDRLAAINVTAEVFNIANGEVISTSSKIINIAAGATANFDVAIDAPATVQAIGYRIKATAGQFTDGEQMLLPILPATTPVIETQPFYMAPDSTLFTTTIPTAGSDTRFTLQFCENPLWYVVTALPGLASDKPSSAPEAASNIFSAAVADNLIRRYPQIESALKAWTESDRSDSTLVSMLSRNADLKTMLLQATPWTLDAQSDTERMQRLALLFDRKEIDTVYDTAIKKLSDLQQPDGGWCWIANYPQSSVWATSQTLFTLGRLNEMGFLPESKSLSKMVTKALDYLREEVTKDYKKFPDADYTWYVQITDLWPKAKQNTTTIRVISRVVSNISNHWKTFDVATKAGAGMILANHQQRGIAADILKSLREYSTSSPEKGMWWPSVGDSYGGSLRQLGISADALRLFHKLNAPTAEIDAIRQWLILQKQARNWGNSVMTSDIIAAIITTSPSWIEAAAGTTMTISGDTIHPDIQPILGHFSIDISKPNPSGKTLEITKAGKTPAWGAIFEQYTARMTDVDASSCDAVSIQKRFLVQSGTQWIESRNLKVGDRIKVQLTIHVNSDIQYVAIDDDRAACLEPVEQLPTPIFAEGIYFYRENRDSATNIFVDNLPKGTYLLEYEMWVNNSGDFSSGIATLQSQYAPEISAHSAGTIIRAKR